MQTKTLDFSLQNHQDDFVFLLNHYALDPMGGGEALSQFAQENLGTELQKQSHFFSFIVYVDEKPAGLINCVLGFSTFNCAPLLNIHDLIVHCDFRKMGVGEKLLEAAEKLAVQKNCCKITLEVLSGNEPAQNLYKKFGFGSYVLDPTKGHAVFLDKKLSR